MSSMIFSNQKPWNEHLEHLRACNAAFRWRDWALYKAARAKLKIGIKQAKVDHSVCIESHLSSNNPREEWQSIQDITNFRVWDVSLEGSECTAGWEAKQLLYVLWNISAAFCTSPSLTLPSYPPGHCTTPLTVQKHVVRWMLLPVNPKKAAVPDRVPRCSKRAPKRSSSPLAGSWTSPWPRQSSQTV